MAPHWAKLHTSYKFDIFSTSSRAAISGYLIDSMTYLFYLHSLYCSLNIVRVNKSRRLRWAGHVARMKAFKILTGKPTGKWPLGRHRWEDNIRMYLKEIGINSRNRVDSDQVRVYWSALVNAALNLWVPYVITVYRSTLLNGMSCIILS